MKYLIAIFHSTNKNCIVRVVDMAIFTLDDKIKPIIGNLLVFMTVTMEVVSGV